MRYWKGFIITLGIMQIQHIFLPQLKQNNTKLFQRDKFAFILINYCCCC